MKKIAKLSLVAAVAVAGLSTANAKPLEEAIKNVDVSGTAVYRYDDRDVDSSNITQNSYKVGINLKSKFNDTMTFNTRTIVGDGNIGTSENTDMVVLQTNTADANADVTVSHANFAYTGIANTTIIAGKQAVPSPFAVQIDAADDEDTGAGITGIFTAGPATIAATYLNQTNLITNGADIAGLGVMGDISGVALDAWYLDIQETSAQNDGHQAYTLGASTKIDVVNLYARYSAIAHDAANTDTESVWKIGASTKVGIVGFAIDYGQSNDVNNYQTGVNLTGDADANVNLQGWGLNLNSNDASLVKVSTNVDVMPSLNLSATYVDLSYDNAGVDTDAKEYYAQATYRLGGNFTTYARIGQVDDDANTDKGTRGRLHVQYSF